MAPLLDEIRDLSRGWRWGRRPLVPRSAEPFQGPPPSDEFPTEWARTAVARKARGAFLRGVLGPAARNELDLTLEGLDNLETVQGPVMFFSNHSSHLDASLIMTTLPPKWRDRTAVGAAKDYFFDVWWRAFGTAFVYNAFPIDRTRGRGGGISTASRLIDEGWNLVVFPEGTRSRDGWMNRLRHGAARMCIDAGIPAVPIGIRGAHAAMPTGNSWPRAGRPPVSVRYGTALYPAEGEDHRDFSRRMTQAVAQLLDEDRTTWFESVQRAARDETPIPSGPQGPKWLRVWEGSKSPVRRGPKRAWPR